MARGISIVSCLGDIRISVKKLPV